MNDAHVNVYRSPQLAELIELLVAGGAVSEQTVEFLPAGDGHAEKRS